jgi:hypothetical protein
VPVPQSRAQLALLWGPSQQHRFFDRVLRPRVQGGSSRQGPVPAPTCSVYPQPGKLPELTLKLARYDFSCHLTAGIVSRPRHPRGNRRGKEPPRWSLDDDGVVTPLDSRQPDGK